MRNYKLKHYGLIILTVITLIIGCTCGSPTEPPPVVQKEYPIYFYNRVGEHILFKYNPYQQVMDSVIIPWDPDKITVSADGKLLYLVCSQSVVVIDTENYQLVTELPYFTLDAVTVSDDNNLIAIVGDTLRILRTSDYQIIYADTSSNTYRGVFSKDNNTFYCGVLDTTNSGAVYKLDLSGSTFTKEIKRFYINDVQSGVRSIKPNNDESKWILYTSFGIEIYDVALDSIIFRDIIVGGWGSTALSSDGQKVYYTLPGRPGSMSNFPPIVKIIDIPTRTIEQPLDSFILSFDTISWQAIPNDLALTPDDQYLAVISGDIFWFGFHTVRLDSSIYIENINYNLSQFTLSNVTTQKVK